MRCSGGAPCGRCDTRSLECQYPTTRRSRVRIRDAAFGKKFPHGGHDHFHEAQVPRSSSPQLSGIHAEPKQIDDAVSRQTECLGGDVHESSTTPEANVARPEAKKSTDLVQTQEILMPFDSSSWDQSMSSTLNWLPSEILSSASHDSGATQAGTKNTHVAHTTGQPHNYHPTAPPDYSVQTEVDRSRQHTRNTGRSSHQDAFIGLVNRSSNHHLDKEVSWHAGDHGNRISHPFPGTAVTSEHPLENSRCRFDFPKSRETRSQKTASQVIHPVQLIQVSTYNEIHRNFLLLCRNVNPFFEVYESGNFPSPDDCNYYFQCYFDSSQAGYPFLHWPIFDPNQCHWLLTLAIIAIGCDCSSRETDQDTAAFHEMIRRAIVVEVRNS